MHSQRRYATTYITRNSTTRGDINHGEHSQRSALQYAENNKLVGSMCSREFVTYKRVKRSGVHLAHLVLERRLEYMPQLQKLDKGEVLREGSSKPCQSLKYLSEAVVSNRQSPAMQAWLKANEFPNRGRHHFVAWGEGRPGTECRRLHSSSLES